MEGVIGMVSPSKRYFWLKLKEDFFQDEAIEWLEEQKNGKEYVLFYLKLCLKALKNDGMLIRQVGNMLVPYDVPKLAEMTKTSVDTVAVALKTFRDIGLVETLESGELYLTKLYSMVGSGSANPAAVKKREYRERKKIAQTLTGVDKEVDTMGTKCPTEIRDKSLELRDKSLESNNKPTRHKYGDYENVLLSDEDLEKLKAEFPSDWQSRIARLSEYIASTGKKYKNHLATIRSWARNDKEKQPSGKSKERPRLDDLDDLF